MADERSAFPGDTESAGGSAAGRAPGRWLDRETAELLLRGESLESVDPATRDQAERLARTLGALAVEPSQTKVELPGEDAALTAFRAARSGNDVERAGFGRPGPAHSSDAGLVRLGRPAPAVPGSRWGRPVRFGLTAVLAAGMLGGVAVAAGTGALPSPFDDDPTPAASISAAVPPDRTLVSPSPTGTRGSGTPTPGGGADDSSGEAVGGGAQPTPSSEAGDGKSAGSGTWWGGVASSCRAVRDGTALTPGRKRALEGAAGGTSHVWTYCKGLLRHTGAGSDGKDGKGTGKNGGAQGNDQNGSGDQGGGQGGDDDGHISPIAPGGSGGSSSGGSGRGSGGGHLDNGAAAPGSAGSSGSSGFAPLTRHPSAHTTVGGRTPAPSPTYSAL
ncbi:hypothetical protein ABTY96_25545 [Streptomyces sp. NPDC096057]|uniref:hypothetical protein n=1 Tax=Streptomyces sp. NPDC096057 TaxID=3155543 RepID=UPI00331F464B